MAHFIQSIGECRNQGIGQGASLSEELKGRIGKFARGFSSDSTGRIILTFELRWKGEHAVKVRSV
jgi:hypothetical protein